MTDASYTAALARLTAFAPHAGWDYARDRNFDDPTVVSGLSPYLRHRIISEDTVLRAVLARHSPEQAERFIAEVFWRTYWKGWLELRPGVWDRYRQSVTADLNRVQTESGLRADWEAACRGDTGIDCFDHWAQQLVDTGYLHNHARMWFASIWIFTLRLPWALGADFFLRHLLDGDPASNTLSWRWVAGLQTKGKTYLADPDNIAKYTRGRFRPKGLAQHAIPLEDMPHPDAGPMPMSDAIKPGARLGLLITEEDLDLDWLLDRVTPQATAIVQTTGQRSPLHVAPNVTGFVGDAMADCVARFQGRLGPVSNIDAEGVPDWMDHHEIDQLVTSYIPTGPTRDALRSAPLCQIIRPYDSAAWPHATHGFFRFRKQIPQLLNRL